MKQRQLADLAYYRTGGDCNELHMPSSLDELAAIVKSLRQRAKPFFVLGGGTNSLVCDELWPGAVIALSNMAELKVLTSRGRIYCEAGVENSQFAHFAADKGLNGAGWMYRLPGQMGGTVRMNARCYGGEISSIVVKVVCVDPEGRIVIHENPAEIFFGYKDTSFMKTQEIVAAVELQLVPGDVAETRKLMKFCEDDRTLKGQFLYPSCGCVFKNDYSVGVPSGMLLEASGVKSMRMGGAEVSPKHANFVFNKGATSREIIELTLMMREAVYQKFGVWLQYEMEILGQLPSDLAQAVSTVRSRRPEPEELTALRLKFQSR